MSMARFWGRVWLLLLLGYSVFGRSFAYIGVPSLKLFIGEVTLAGFLLTAPHRSLRTWLASLVRHTNFSKIAWSLYLFLGYGLFEVGRGLLYSHATVTTLQNFAFNYYALFIFLGFWVGRSQPDRLYRAIRWLAWVNGLYGLAYIFILNRVPIVIPGTPNVPVFGQPGGSALALLGLLSLANQPLRHWPLLLLNAFVLIGVQVRSEWLGFGLGLLVWSVVRGQVSRLASVVSAFLVLFLLLYTLDVSIPAPKLRGGEISVEGIVARALAPLNPEAAASLVGQQAYAFARSVNDWRLPWWRAIWEEVHSDPTKAILGLGYGYPLSSLVSFVGKEVRTPHNAFFYALGYTGWIGVIFFLSFHVAIGVTVARTFKNPFGIMVWVAIMGMALFNNFLETPYGAIPYYLLVGHCLGVGDRCLRNHRKPYVIHEQEFAMARVSTGR